MPTLTAFADEISPDIHEQLACLKRNGVSFVELRGAFGANVLKFTAAQRSEIKTAFFRAGVKVACIASPIGKIRMDEPFEPHFAEFRHACDLADEFGCRHIRLFSYYAPRGGSIEPFREQVLERMLMKLDFAKLRGVILVHENEKGIYGNRPERVAELARVLRSPNFTTAFDAANYVEEGCLPVYTTCYYPLRDEIGYIHLKDNSHAQGRCVPLGEGDGDWAAVFRDLVERKYNGFMAIEPHLKAAGAMAGFSGPDLFGTAVTAIRKMADAAGMSLA